MKNIFIVCALVLVFKEVTSTPTGAPVSVCHSMTPNHGNHQAQATEAPVKINLSKTFVNSGETLTVRVESIDPNYQFKGFMVQAKKANGSSEPVGIMEPADKLSKIIDCDGPTTATHLNPEFKNSMTFLWTAPEMTGNVQFQ